MVILGRATRAEWAEFVREVEKHRQAMTLGQAITWLQPDPIGCACIGGPQCCRYTRDHALNLQRAAHIVAKLLADKAKADLA